MKKVLLVDNYDSFTYNLAQYFGELGCELTVVRNDAITVAEAQKRDFTHLVISPGPGNPTQSGVCNDLIKTFAGKKYMGIERSTVVIGEDGTVETIWRKVKPDEHAAKLLQALS